MEIHGKYNSAIVYTDVIEDEAVAQIRTLCDQPFAAGSKIRIMPDAHAGAGCVIGFTADLGEMVVPNLVGVDIGCGMLTVELGKKRPDFTALDKLIRRRIPSGMNVREKVAVAFPEMEELHCYSALQNKDRLRRSIGTLGGGNHFIEVDKSEDGVYFLVIHTGSRNLGKQVAEYYQDLAVSILQGKIRMKCESDALIARYRAEGREAELSEALRSLHNAIRENSIPAPLCYLTGEERQQYLHDMRICQEFAACNRRVIAEEIVSALFKRRLSDMVHFETVHNYIDLESNLIRKGAVSAKEGEKLLIPINMRDGSLVCIGKGNPEWNFSAPHGAGRTCSRSKAHATFTLKEYRASMEGIWTTSVSRDTIDECPMAYKSMDDIVKYLAPTAEIVEIIKPVYNFKAGE